MQYGRIKNLEENNGDIYYKQVKYGIINLSVFWRGSVTYEKIVGMLDDI